MTPLDLDSTLDAVAVDAGSNPDQMPGLITVHTDHWINVLGAIRAEAATLADGLRHRDIKIEVASTNTTVVLARADAGERGAPSRELLPR